MSAPIPFLFHPIPCLFLRSSLKHPGRKRKREADPGTKRDAALCTMHKKKHADASLRLKARCSRAYADAGLRAFVCSQYWRSLSPTMLMLIPGENRLRRPSVFCANTVQSSARLRSKSRLIDESYSHNYLKMPYKLSCQSLAESPPFTTARDSHGSRPNDRGSMHFIAAVCPR